MIFWRFFFLSVYFLHSPCFLFPFGSGSVFLAMLVIKATLLICFLCVGFSRNWLNADKGQNCEKIERSIPSIFRLLFVAHKYCYSGNSKQFPPNLKLKNLLLLLCGEVAVNPGPTNFKFVNCRSIRNKGPLLHDLIQCSDLDILVLVETHIRPTCINVHLDFECGDRSRFNDILQCCSLIQGISGPTNILGHTLDILISPCD